MIERMKKITVIVSLRERTGFVKKLRKLGVLHIKAVVKDDFREVSFIEDRISRIDRFIRQVLPYDEGRPDRRVSGTERDVLSSEEDTAQDLRDRQEALTKLEELRHEKERLEEWGNIDPLSLKTLDNAGVYVKLYEVPVKKMAKLPSGLIYEIGRSGGIARAALVTRDAEKELPFSETELPDRSRAGIEKEERALSARIDEIEERMKNRARGLAAARECLEKLRKELVFLKVKSGMKNESAFAYLQGFCPEKKLPGLRSLCDGENAGFVAEEPDNPEETPTLITNPRWIELVKPVFDFMNTLPGYREFDISALFLVFFSLFFAMIIGDAGYGLIFIAATYLARRKFKDAPREPFFLIYLLGGCTVIWGALTGTWFGVEKLSTAPVLGALVIESIGSFTEGNQNLIIFICFIIGAVHLTLAHAMRIIRYSNSLKVLAEAGWIMILWGLFFAAVKFVLGGDFPVWAGWLLAVGATLALFFAEPEKGIVKGAMSTLTQLPLSVISSFSDVVSYLRLFAVGYATVVVASSFNNMAIGDGVTGILGSFIAAMVLFLGHTLNIVLGCMAVIVHGIRLNMLEFSGHLGMQWTGKKYDPFRE